MRRFCVVLILLLLWAASARADAYGGYEYTIANGRATITAYTGAGGPVSVPETLSGCPVVGIGPRAFAYQTSVTSVELPDTLEKLGEYAFLGCENMESVSLPERLTSMGRGCFRLTGLRSATVPGSLRALPPAAFAECVRLTDVTLSKGVLSVGDDAFSGCPSLTRVELPASVTTIGLSTLLASPNAVMYAPDGSGALSVARGIGLPACASGTEYLYAVSGGEAKVTRYLGRGEGAFVPDRLGDCPVTEIGDGAFVSNASLKTVRLPATVHTIGANAFQNCAALQKVTFEGDSELISVENNAFSACASLGAINLPETCARIGDRAFFGCASLDIDLPSCLQLAGERAFASSGVTDVIVPDGLYSISEGLFENCASLETVDLRGALYFYGEAAFAGCTSLREARLSASFDRVSAYAFYGCENLTSVSLPEKITRISAGAFMGCAYLSDVSLPASLTALGDRAFYRCGSLARLYLPASATDIGADLLSPGATIICNPGSPARAWAEQNGFAWTPPYQYRAEDDGTVTLTAFLARDARAEIPDEVAGKKVGGVDARVFAGYDFLETYAASGEGLLTAREGCLYKGSEFVACPPGLYASRLSLPEGVTHIGAYALSNVASLERIDIPASFISAPTNALEGTDAVLYGRSDAARAFAESAGRTYRALATGITLTRDGGDVAYVGDSLLLRAQVSPSDAYDPSYTFASLDPDVASISQSGEITVRAPGQARFTATSPDGPSATLTVTLWPDYVADTDFSLDKTSVAMGVSGTCPLSLSAIEPSNASFRALSWTSGAPEIVSVSDTEGESVVLRAMGKTGTATISATSRSGIVRTCKVTVRAMSAALGKTSLTLTRGKTARLTVRLYPAPTVASAIWTTDDPSVATVSDGVVTAAGVGKTYVRVDAGSGKTLACLVTVKERVSDITISGPSEVGSGKRVQLRALALPEDAANRKVVWTSSSDLVKISTYGVAQAKSGVSEPAVVYITAEAADGAGAVSEPFMLTVRPAARKVLLYKDDLALSGALTLDLELDAGGVRLTGICEPSTASQAVTWTSGLTAVASVDENGMLTPRKKGITTVTATASDGSGARASITVRVGKRAQSIEVTGRENIASGLRATFKATVSPADATVRQVIWKSLTPDAASVNAYGVVHAKKVSAATEAVVAARAADGSGAECQYKFTVWPAAKSLRALVNGQEAGTVTLDLSGEATAKLDFEIAPSGARQAASWSTSNAKIASVDKDGTVTGLAPGSAYITAKATDGTGVSKRVTVKVIRRVTEIAVSGATELAGGRSATLKASVAPANATQKTVRWTSLDTSVATVNAYGTVSAKKTDATRTVVIAASAADGGGIVAEHKITVRPLSAKVTMLHEGEAAKGTRSIDLGAEPTLALSARITPADARQDVSWQSSNVYVATVSADGLVTGKKAGTATITAKAADGSGRYASLTVRVGYRVTRIELSGPESLAAGKWATMKLSLAPDNATLRTVSWKSSDSAAATVNASGVVIAKAVNKSVPVTITATAKDGGGAVGMWEMTIRPLTRGARLLLEGEIIEGNVHIDRSGSGSAALSYEAKPEDAWQRAKWQTSDASVATVDEDGRVTAHKNGIAIITASARDGSGKSAKVKIIVETSVTEIVLTGPDTLASGETGEIRANVLPESAGNRSLVWDSSNPGALAVADGRLTAGKVTEETVVIVTATAADGRGAEGAWQVRVTP